MAVAAIPTLESIREKVEADERLDFEDGLALMESDDVLALGELADLAQAREVLRAGAGPEFQRFEPSATDRLADGYGRYRELVAADRLEVGV